MLNLFTVGAVNYTTKIVMDSYAVQKTKEFQTWTDANLVSHKYGGRTRIKGSFTMKFQNKAEYDAFVSTLASAEQAGGYYIATVYCVNTNTTEIANLTIDYSPTLTQHDNLQLDVLEFNVDVEEM